MTDVKSVPQAGNGPPPTTPLPHSNLAVQTAPANGPHINPTNPTGIIPSTGTSVYDVDVAQFEGSGQMWRRPGSDISDWFNYGFDEVTYPKFLKYRQDMEQGRAALVSYSIVGPVLTLQAQMGNMNQMTPEVAQLLHLPMGQMNNMQQLQMQQQMQQMMAMQGMDQAMFMQMQQMQNMQQNEGNGQPHGEQEEGSIPQENETAVGLQCVIRADLIAAVRAARGTCGPRRCRHTWACPHRPASPRSQRSEEQVPRQGPCHRLCRRLSRLRCRGWLWTPQPRTQSFPVALAVREVRAPRAEPEPFQVKGQVEGARARPRLGQGARQRKGSRPRA